MKIALGISGASALGLAEAFIDNLPEDIELYVALSKGAKLVAKSESKKLICYDNEALDAAISSGSFGVDATVIIPCSTNTLAKIACGISDNLITRIASVALKERRPLLLAPRELPFDTIALENMHKLSLLGAIIAPATLGYYAQPKNLQDMERFIVGKWYDCLGISHNLFPRWKQNKEQQ